MAGVFPPQGSAAGGLTGVTEDGGSPVNVVTVADALNVGTTTDAAAAGEFSAGSATAAIKVDGAAGTITREASTNSGISIYGYGNASLTLGTNWNGSAGTPRLALDQTGRAIMPSTGTLQWGPATISAGGYDLALSRSAAGRLEVSDPSGSAGARIDLLDAGGTADAFVAESGGACLISGTQGVNLAFNNASRWLIRNAAMTPNAAGASSLGSTALPVDALTLGDGTAQVTLGHDGATDGLLTIADPNVAANAALAIANAAGTVEATLTCNGSGSAVLNGTSVVVHRIGGTDAFYTTAASVFPGGTKTLGESGARWASGHFGPSGLTVYDSSGNADVSLSEDGSGRAQLNGASATTLAVGGTPRVWTEGTMFGPWAAGTYTLGNTSYEWGDFYSSGTIYLGAGQEATIRTGTGSPESSVTAPVGSLYLRSDGGTGTTLYVKESGTGNTGWVAK